LAVVNRANRVNRASKATANKALVKATVNKAMVPGKVMIATGLVKAAAIPMARATKAMVATKVDTRVMMALVATALVNNTDRLDLTTTTRAINKADPDNLEINSALGNLEDTNITREEDREMIPLVEMVTANPAKDNTVLVNRATTMDLVVKGNMDLVIKGNMGLEILEGTIRMADSRMILMADSKVGDKAMDREANREANKAMVEVGMMTIIKVKYSSWKDVNCLNIVCRFFSSKIEASLGHHASRKAVRSGEKSLVFLSDDW
jgi:hypothetical protein